jgi:hypothetical protein
MFEDSLATITDTVGNVNQQLYGNTTPSVTTELSDQQMRRRKVLRLVVFLVILGGITTLIIYKFKK